MTNQQKAPPSAQRFSVSAMRPKLMLEVAAEMVGRNDWPQRNARIASDAFVTAFCESLDARKDRIAWSDDGSSLPLARMVRDTPLDVPLHPAAERFWRSIGCL